MTIRGVLFDVDGTLFAYEAAEESGTLAHLAAEGLLSRFESPAAALRLWRGIMEVEYARFTRGELTFVEQQLVRTRRFLAAIAETAEERAAAEALADRHAAEWFAGYAAHRHAQWAAYDDAAPALAALAPSCRLGVVSNSATEHQRKKLKTIGLLDYFTEPIICSQEHGAAKPAASIFLAGCAALGLPPEEVAYVGDVFELDAIGARDAGLHAVWLDRAGVGGAEAADAGVSVIRSLAEVGTVCLAR